jgi:peptidoglycan hydrolase CwlO-like protein
LADEIGRATPAQVGLSDVMEHLAIAFGGIYEKLTERDLVVNTLSTQIVQLNEDVTALSNRIEGMHRSLSERIDALAAGADAR